MMPATKLACSALLLTLVYAAPMRSAQTGVQLEMRNVRLRVDEGIILDISRLRGVMVSRSRGTSPVFDDQRSYYCTCTAPKCR